MSYQVIARKWRPQLFADVIGQEHIARTLQNAIQQNRVGHAYLFVGPRGIGKTTTARIFAKALNCESPNGSEPCCACRNCEEITLGNSLDVVEIDGASHNKVEDVRDIRDSVNYTPNRSKYRIFIIDEVHMLSPAAWNALLKTIEEPPAHVKFLFATTESHKVLPTILSRCQRLDLKRISVGLIAQRLRFIADNDKDENGQPRPIHIDDRALVAIARAADGGMRDAQSIFDQMISFCGGPERHEAIREQDVMDVFGLASGSELRDLTRALLTNDLATIVDLLQQFSDRGRDLEHLHGDLVEFLRNLLVFQLCRNPQNLLDVSAAELEDHGVLATVGNAAVTQRLFEGLMSQETFVRHSLNKRLALEVAFIRVMQDAHSVNVSDVIARLVQWKQQGVALPPLSPPVQPTPPPAAPRPAPRTDGPLPAMPAKTVPPAATVPAPPPAPQAAPKPLPPPPAAPTPALAKPVRAVAPAAAPVTPDTAAVAPPPSPVPSARIIPPAPAAAQPPAPSATPTEVVDGNDVAELTRRWQNTCERIRQDIEGSHLAAVAGRLRPILFRNDVLTLAYDDTVSAEELDLLESEQPKETIRSAVRQTFGQPGSRVVLKRWVDRVSSAEQRPRLVSSQEVRQRIDGNPFVKQVCEMFQAKIVDVRG